ncbi:hypothetical protein BJX70DRAFT_398929 [Aspergillus crustosus]
MRRPALSNDYFAHEYGDTRGVLICRFDDTKPTKESQEYQDSILDYLQQMYDTYVSLIKSGKAYADNAVQGVMQDQRKDGIASACRDISPEDSLSHFSEMKSGSADGLQWCIRAKISFDNAVIEIHIDPVAARYTAIPKAGLVIAFVEGIEGIVSAEKAKHKNPALGTKEVVLSPENIISQDDVQQLKEQ